MVRNAMPPSPSDALPPPIPSGHDPEHGAQRDAQALTQREPAATHVPGTMEEVEGFAL